MAKHNKIEWDIFPNDNLMECLDCKHQAKEWAETDKFQEVEGIPLSQYNGTLKGKEIFNQVRCPKCKSWSYFEK